MNKSIRKFIEYVLKASGLPCDKSAIELLTMIAAHESGGFYYVRQVNGPALGLFQMEPVGFDEVKRYLRLRPERFPGLEWILKTDFQMLNYDQSLATVSARIYFLTKPEAFPASDCPGKAGGLCKKILEYVGGSCDGCSISERLFPLWLMTRSPGSNSRQGR